MEAKAATSDSPVITLLAGETLQVIHVALSSHDHLKGGNHFVAGRTVAGGAKQPGQQEIQQLNCLAKQRRKKTDKVE